MSKPKLPQGMIPPEAFDQVTRPDNEQTSLLTIGRFAFELEDTGGGCQALVHHDTQKEFTIVISNASLDDEFNPDEEVIVYRYTHADDPGLGVFVFEGPLSSLTEETLATEPTWPRVLESEMRRPMNAPSGLYVLIGYRDRAEVKATKDLAFKEAEKKGYKTGGGTWDTGLSTNEAIGLWTKAFWFYEKK